MELIREIKFPEYDTYRGIAYYSSISFITARIPWIFDQFAFQIAEKAEEEIRKYGTPLYIEVWRGGIALNYVFVINYWFYTSEQAGLSKTSLVIPAAVWAIVQAVIYAAAILLGIWLITKSIREVKEIIWGPPDVPSWARMILPLALGASLVMFIYLKFKQIRR